jgi:hypothetical protein
LLFRWLNRWGCRQFALDHHATTASNSLIDWADAWMLRLPGPDAGLADLSEGEIRTCAEAYADLSSRAASLKQRAGQSLVVTYGPTGASKTLFALRPKAVPPWDDPIRKAMGATGDIGSFRRYLTIVAAQLRELAAQASASVDDLPLIVGRADSPPPKLIDEYNWIVVTKGLTPPDGATYRSLENEGPRQSRGADDDGSTVRSRRTFDSSGVTLAGPLKGLGNRR